MKNEYALSDSEFIVMKAVWKVWDGKNAVQTKQFFPHLSEHKWTAAQTFVFIRRLEDKGLLKAERSPESRRENVYYPLMTEEEWKYSQSQSFISSIHGGYRGLILNLLENDKNGEQTVSQIQSIIDEFNKRNHG